MEVFISTHLTHRKLLTKHHMSTGKSCHKTLKLCHFSMKKKNRNGYRNTRGVCAHIFSSSISARGVGIFSDY
jgi:hypothetical protein